MLQSGARRATGRCMAPTGPSLNSKHYQGLKNKTPPLKDFQDFEIGGVLFLSKLDSEKR